MATVHKKYVIYVEKSLMKVEANIALMAITL